MAHKTNISNIKNVLLKVEWKCYFMYPTLCCKCRFQDSHYHWICSIIEYKGSINDCLLTVNN